MIDASSLFTSRPSSPSDHLPLPFLCLLHSRSSLQITYGNLHQRSNLYTAFSQCSISPEISSVCCFFTMIHLLRTQEQLILCFSSSSSGPSRWISLRESSTSCSLLREENAAMHVMVSNSPQLLSVLCLLYSRPSLQLSLHPCRTLVSIGHMSSQMDPLPHHVVMISTNLTGHQGRGRRFFCALHHQLFEEDFSWDPA